MIHHAHLLIGAPEETESYLNLLLESLGVDIPNNPDFFAFRMETFGIDDARELTSLSARKAVIPRLRSGQSGKKIFFVSPARLTLEAQNALLKTFEDPFPDTHFFLAVREEALILSTLRSRMQVVHVPRRSASGYEEAKKFLDLPVKDRLLFAKEFALQEKSLPVFLDDLLSLLKRRNEGPELLGDVYNARRFVHDPAVLPRLIIEHLSLVLP